MDMKDITYIVVEGLSGGGVKKVKGSAGTCPEIFRVIF